VTGPPERLLVTGGAGFIGSAFVRRTIARHPGRQVIVLDKLTYAGNLANLAPIADNPRYRVEHGDINDADLVDRLADEVDAIVNFAAESHVDRSIEGPDAFIRTDVHGTFTLLEAARRSGVERFVQVSTDEVYGDVATGASAETDPLRPRSPYAASKAGGDLLALAYHATHGLPVLITRGSNTYGPRQYPEKVIPLFITNALDGEPLPLYGDGGQVRDWLHVDDHCAGIETVLRSGTPGETYNVGAAGGTTNLELTHLLLELLDRPTSLIRHVEDRLGLDRRYALDSSKLAALGWSPRIALDEGLVSTVAWYRDHPDWWRPIKDGSFGDYYQRQYARRLAEGRPAS
jgi:dTDP-glucose 4,6-dehydratase